MHPGPVNICSRKSVNSSLISQECFQRETVVLSAVERLDEQNEGLGIPHEKAILGVVRAKLTSVDCNGGWRQRTHLLPTERDTTVQFPILTF